jgi:hypothetical protein
LTVQYAPGESNSGLFGGNSNWRGPIWFPVNYLLVEALQRYHLFYGNDLKVECPTGSGRMLNLYELSKSAAGLFAFSILFVTLTEADALSARSHSTHTTQIARFVITKILTQSITICWKSMENRDSRKSRKEGSSNLIDLDSTSGLRRTSSLRILAAKRNYVSKSSHKRKACPQWSQHVYRCPLSSSQTASE